MNPVLVTLDKPRAIKWNARARLRNSSLEKPTDHGDLGKPRRMAYALAAHIWAGLVEEDHNFADPFALAPFLESSEQQLAAIKAVGEMLNEAYPQKKTEPASACLPNGPTP